jgi:hypothetical protein
MTATERHARIAGLSDGWMTALLTDLANDSDAHRARSTLRLLLCQGSPDLAAVDWLDLWFALKHPGRETSLPN